MDLSVIIVNYFTSNLLGACLESVIKLTDGIEYEVIIVDNNSEKDLENKLAEKAPGGLFRNLHFIYLDENIGFGRANNEGLRIATGRNILFLNPDTILLNNALKILSDFLDSHPEAGACGGNLYDEYMFPAQSFRRFLPGVFNEFNELLHTLPQKVMFGRNNSHNHKGRPFQVGFIVGADLMVKKNVLEETGGFSDDFFLYYEETDLCFRIKKKGWKIFSVPQARIQHLESKSFGNDSAWESESKTQWMEKSRGIYYRRNLSPYKRWIANFLYSIFLKSRLLLIKNPSKRAYYQLRWKIHKANPTGRNFS